jgi:hypothetical protein
MKCHFLPSLFLDIGSPMTALSLGDPGLSRESTPRRFQGGSFAERGEAGEGAFGRAH